MSAKRRKAKELLVHYLTMCIGEYDSDNVSEIENIVDFIIEACIEETKDGEK